MRHFLLKPPDDSGSNDAIFNGPYGALRDILRDRGVSLQTVDRGALGDADCILCFNHCDRFLGRCLRAGVPRERLVLAAFEPAAVLPRQYCPDVWQSYALILTWNDAFVDGRRFRKLRFPQGQQRRTFDQEPAAREFLTLINANKFSMEPNELYSFRRAAISYFDRRPGFALYGHGWSEGYLGRLRSVMRAVRSRPRCRSLLASAFSQWLSFRRFRSYRGATPDKHATLSRFKFCLCFENQDNAPGYITEKIFDCLFCKTVPVYLGAPNIASYVPSDCYIDMRRFASFADLETYLRQVPEDAIASMQTAGQRFLASNAFQAWTPHGAFGELARNLLEPALVRGAA